MSAIVPDRRRATGCWSTIRRGFSALINALLPGEAILHEGVEIAAGKQIAGEAGGGRRLHVDVLVADQEARPRSTGQLPIRSSSMPGRGLRRSESQR